MPGRMTPTAMCHTMNQVYDMLRTLSVEQLHEYRDQVLLGYGSKMSIAASELLLYQVDFTIHRKQTGRW